MPTEPGPVAAVEPESTADEKRCPRCNRQFPMRQKFCTVDGAALEVVAATAETAPEPRSSGQVKAQAVPPVEPAAPEPPSGLACPACGTVWPAGTRFCERDGTPLVAGAAAPRPAGPTPAEVWDDDDYQPRPARGWMVPVLGAVLLAAAGGGYLWWSGRLSPLTDAPAPEASASASETPVEDATTEVAAAPGLLGTYRIHIADQDITLVVLGDRPRPMGQLQATISYLNTVTGDLCAAAITTPGNGEAVTRQDVPYDFTQQPIPGRPVCPQSIPLRLTASGPVNERGVITSVGADWRDPATGGHLMDGEFTLEAAR